MIVTRQRKEYGLNDRDVLYAHFLSKTKGIESFRGVLRFCLRQNIMNDSEFLKYEEGLKKNV